MPGISRQGVDAAGGVIIAGSSRVFANGAPVVRIGDAVAAHGRNPHRGPVMVGGSGRVFSDGISVCRQGDPASCGHPATGSSNVNAG